MVSVDPKHFPRDQLSLPSSPRAYENVENFFKFIYLVLAVLGFLAFSLVVEMGTTLCCGVRAPHGDDISCPGARARGHTDLAVSPSHVGSSCVRD